jgi:hypothetical protein
VKEAFQVDLCPRTIQKKVASGDIGISPVRKGPKGIIDELHYKNLCMAAESYVVIQSASGKSRECTFRRLRARIKKVVRRADVQSDSCLAQPLLQRVLKDTSINLNVSNANNVKDRRIRWTNYRNISMWFDNWERDLVNLGTATRDPLTNKVTIPKEQLLNIANFNKSCLSFDGSNSVRGGRPEAVLYDPRFPHAGKATSKSALTTTLITGSTAAGEALPLHLQFQTKAKTADAMPYSMMSLNTFRASWGSSVQTKSARGQSPLVRTKRVGWMMMNLRNIS